MNKMNVGVVAAYTILPISNVMEIGGSVLPERFNSRSESQDGPIVGGDLGSTSFPAFPLVTITHPTIVIA